MLNPEQIRAARALLDWSTSDLAVQAGLTVNGINKIERGHVDAHRDTLRKLQETFEKAGVEFIGSIGVQWARHVVRTLTGVVGLKQFFDEVREVARTTTEEIVICGFNENYFEEKLGSYSEYHRKEMSAMTNVVMKCLIKEEDYNLGASSYCQYRWQSKEHFSEVPFYTFGDRTAIIVPTGPDSPLILVIYNKAISNAWRRQFNLMWNASQQPKEKK